MLTTILAQFTNEFITQMVLFGIVAYAIFFIHLYIFREIFRIPSFIRLQKAQTKLLQEIAKAQGVDATTVKTIISENVGWETDDQRTTSNTTA